MTAGRPKRKYAVYGVALTNARIAAELSLEDVAGRIGRDKATVSRWEREEVVPSPEDILKILCLYGADKGIIKL